MQLTLAHFPITAVQPTTPIPKPLHTYTHTEKTHTHTHIHTQTTMSTTPTTSPPSHPHLDHPPECGVPPPGSIFWEATLAAAQAEGNEGFARELLGDMLGDIIVSTRAEEAEAKKSLRRRKLEIWKMNGGVFHVSLLA